MYTQLALCGKCIYSDTVHSTAQSVITSLKKESVPAEMERTRQRVLSFLSKNTECAEHMTDANKFLSDFHHWENGTLTIRVLENHGWTNVILNEYYERFYQN